jgi:hypothetical protein
LTSDVATDADASTNAEAPLASPRAVVRQYLDVVLLAVALVPAIELGTPALGYWLGAGGWILQRWLAVYDRRWTGKAADPVKRLAITLGEAFGRIWLLAGVIVLASALGERQDGLTAAVVIFAAYSVAFVIRLISGPPGKKKVAA